MGEFGRPLLMTNVASSGSTPGLRRRSSPARWHAVSASYLGWTLDAFDFFTVVFLIDVLASHFRVSKADIVLALTGTLAMRPVGAFLFGLITDRFGRRKSLMGVVVFFSVIELACGFAPSYAVFLALRCAYGVGMGGEWGVGASLSMESVPARWRGLISGFVQSGYSMGYLLASVAAHFVLPFAGWRAMFWAGAAAGAVLPFYVWLSVPESEAWKQHRAPTLGMILRPTFAKPKSLCYLVVMMTLLMFLSHGTQDLYPDFLETAHHISALTVSNIAILYNLGAILGAITFGSISEKLGRRRGITAGLILCVVSIPVWAFAASRSLLAAGAFLMQAGVQGTWGIVPAHLIELSPDTARGLMPGFVYQLGILIAAPTNTIEYALRDHLGYAWALTAFEALTILLLFVVVELGPERRGRKLEQESAA
jgi:SHS family lactate transporter-like MFS transporter